MGIHRFYTPYEVAQHNSVDDLWVSFLGSVYNLTPVVKENDGPLIQPLLADAGKDISHWFDPATKDIRTRMDPTTNQLAYYLPQGAILGLPAERPVTNQPCPPPLPWWQDSQYWVGSLSQRQQLVVLKNVLTEQSDVMEVPVEESAAQIRDRYLAINRHACSYTWRALRKTKGGQLDWAEVDMGQTLGANGVPDEGLLKEELGLPSDMYLPVVHLYWNDDLTVD